VLHTSILRLGILTLPLAWDFHYNFRREKLRHFTATRSRFNGVQVRPRDRQVFCSSAHACFSASVSHQLRQKNSNGPVPAGKEKLVNGIKRASPARLYNRVD
jgi:hypothetical protein